MHKSLRKQLVLIAFFGPFGLLYTNIVVALTLVFATLFAIYSSASSMNIGQLALIGATALVISFVSGIHLVDKHNRKATKEFELSSYCGSLSYKTISNAPPDYHAALSKFRRKKATKNILALCLAALCITYSALIIKPYIIFESELAHTTTADTTTLTLHTTTDTVQPLRVDLTPSWNHLLQNETFTSSLKAMEYTNSGDIPYLPEVQISCHESTRTISFSVKEILGTESTPISIILDDNLASEENWTLGPSYQVADYKLSTRLLNQLKSAAHLSLLYKPFGQDHEKTARFNFTDGVEAINTFEYRCGQLHAIDSVDAQVAHANDIVR